MRWTVAASPKITKNMPALAQRAQTTPAKEHAFLFVVVACVVLLAVAYHCVKLNQLHQCNDDRRRIAQLLGESQLQLDKTAQQLNESETRNAELLLLVNRPLATEPLVEQAPVTVVLPARAEDSPNKTLLVLAIAVFAVGSFWLFFVFDCSRLRLALSRTHATTTPLPVVAPSSPLHLLSAPEVAARLNRPPRYALCFVYFSVSDRFCA